MEDIDGGLHPAVDGQSLDEDEDESYTILYMCSDYKQFLSYMMFMLIPFNVT